MLLPIQKLDEHGLRLAFESINRCLEKLIYVPYEAAPWGVSGGAILERPIIDGLLRDCSCATFPAAGVCGVAGTWGIPPLWVSGQVGMAIVYTGSFGSTATIDFGWQIAGVELGTGIPKDNATTFTAPGPATSGFLLKTSIPTMSPVDASHEIVTWKLRRAAGDAYGAAGGDVHVLGVYPLWYASRQ